MMFNAKERLEPEDDITFEWDEHVGLRVFPMRGAGRTQDDNAVIRDPGAKPSDGKEADEQLQGSPCSASSAALTACTVITRHPEQLGGRWQTPAGRVQVEITVKRRARLLG